MRSYFQMMVATIALTILTAEHAIGDQVPLKRDGVEFRQLSESVWMHTSYVDFPNYGPLPANGLIVVDGQTAILIDSGWTDAIAQTVLDWAKFDAGLEITKAVFTHSHIDKMGGVSAIRARGIATYATELSNNLAIEVGLTPAEFNLRLLENDGTLTFGPVELYFPGAGHSPDNIVANVKSEGILFGGCLIRPTNSRSLGNTNDANMEHWDEAVDDVGSAFPLSRVVVPTHGPPGGRELLDLTIQLVRTAVGE